MSEKNKALIRMLSDRFWNKRDATVFDEVFAKDFVDHNPPPGSDGSREGFKQVALALQAAFPDGKTTIEDMVAEGDKVVWRWSQLATHKGPIMGVPATGKRVKIEGITIDRISGGKIVERWSRIDSLGFMQQLGMIPTPGQSK